jgi:hypothetical protein
MQRQMRCCARCLLIFSCPVHPTHCQGEAGDKAQGGQPGGVAANEEDVSRVGGPVAEVDALATSGE